MSAMDPVQFYFNKELTSNLLVHSQWMYQLCVFFSCLAPPTYSIYQDIVADNEDISPVDDDVVAGSQAVEGVQNAVTGQLSISN